MLVGHMCGINWTYISKKQYFAEGPNGVAKCRLLSRMLMYMYLSKHHMPKPGRSVEP